MAFRTYADQVLLEGSNVKTFEAKEDVKQGQLLKFDTNGTTRTVEPSDTDGESKLAGFALYTASAGSQVALAMEGCVVRATSATGTITSGDYVASGGGTTGEEGELKTAVNTDTTGTSPTNGDFAIGEAIEDDAGASGDVKVEVDNAGLV